MVARYVFQELERRHPGQWLGSKRPVYSKTGRGEVLEILRSFDIPLSGRYCERLAEIANLPELLESFALKTVRLDSQMGLWGLCSGRYPLHLRHDIPTPEEMLDIQVQGERYVTLLIRPEEQSEPIGRHAGAFEFLLHDLEHAHKFFADPFSYRGQTAFFNFLRASLKSFDHLNGDPLFEKDLDYLKSDMNSHPLHLFKYLKAIVLAANLRRSQTSVVDLSGFWIEVLNGWPNERLEAALRLNQPGQERPEDHILISSFFAEL